MKADIMVRLRVLRAEIDISQEAVAKAVGLSYRAYNSIENGKSIPSMTTLIAIADFFNVSLDYLTGMSEVRGEK